ncbi:MAG: GNAT family N-acetyltransferase [Lachnospiraceae bacterium]|nr:GNAT family N-acetyltransferase [Lachnospiraceae bacterium]
MEIRTMKIDDYENLYRLWMACKGMGLNDLDDSREGITRFLKRNPDTCFVAAEKETVIGAIMAGHDGRRGFIYHTAVHPDCRKQGIGTKLTEAALQALKECGISKVALVVFSRNAEGNRFWEKMGFTAREDLTYRNRALKELVRLDT